MDAGEDVLRAQARLLKVFLMIGGRKCTEYVNALSASILLWGHYESIDHPAWQMFRNNASAFNEESGEISLSMLARDIARTGVRSDLDKVSRTFALVKAKAEVAQDIGIDISGDDFGSDIRGRELKTDSPEVVSAAAFFATVIRHILTSTYRHYDKSCGVLAKGVTTARVTVPMEAFTASFRSVAPDLKQTMSKLRSSTVSFWVTPHADIWPGAIPAIIFDSEEEEEAGGAGAAGGQAAGEGNRAKRKAPGDGAGAAGGAKKAKKASADELVGCVVAVPAWKFGAVWAGHNFAQPRKAVLIGDVVQFDPNRRTENFLVAMREDAGYKLRLNQSEVEEFKLDGAAAAAAKDTPWKHGKQLDE